MSTLPSSSDSSAVTPWEHSRFCKSVSTLEAHLSRGFLRSQPGRWFPGLNGHWQPFAHIVSAEIRMLELKPVLHIPSEARSGFVYSIEDEPAVLLVDEVSKNSALEAIIPDAIAGARAVAFEYLARRLLASLVKCWSGSEGSDIYFEKDLDSSSVKYQGVVSAQLTVNGHRVHLWFGLGKMLTERLDGMWRRQLRTTANGTVVQAEITRLAVPPSSLSDYLKPGTLIDLETPVSGQVTLLLEGQPWLNTRLCDVAGRLGFETASANASVPATPEGSTMLSVQFGSFNLETSNPAEFQQVGAITESPLTVSDQVQITIHGDKVCQGRLCSYQGRFAVSIL